MRLLILTPEFATSGGGIATFYRHLARALRDAGVAIRVIEGSANHAGEADPREIDGVRVETLDVARLQAWKGRFHAFDATPTLKNHLAAAWAMWEQADGGRDADLVEAADWGMLYVPPIVEATRPIVVQGHASVGQISEHDPVIGEQTTELVIRLLESALLAKADVLQTYSAANAEYWTREAGRRVDVIRPAWSIPPSSTTAGSVGGTGLVVGRVQRWKGPHILCEALERLGDEAPRIDWIGRDTPWGRRASSTSGHLARTYPATWGPVIRPHDPLPPEAVAIRQSRALFNLAPSTWDVFNFTAVEALASGRPTIISRGAGAAELVTDGENGFLYDAEDSAQLADRIATVARLSPDRLVAIAASARETVARELAPERIAQQRIAAYREAMSRFAAAPRPPVAGWLGEACRPSAAGAGEPMDFLDAFGIAPIGRHLGRRLLAKAGMSPRDGSSS